METSVYDNQIFKALGKFKLIRIWPDLNGCLQTLLDIFQQYPDKDYVSHKLLFAKTLSQCLSPVLPAGIQNKALDVYYKAFERMGSEKLNRDFSIWAPGLFQFFHNTGVAQRLQALKLFTDFFLPALSQNSKIGPPLIHAILPGVNDDGSEVKSTTITILDSIQNIIGNKIYWQAMFKCALTSPTDRLSFFIIALQNKAEIIMQNLYPELTKAMFLNVFQDSNVLVVRGALELFNNCFEFFDEKIKFDLSQGCIDLLKVDDQSIYRRVFNWINSFPENAAEAVESSTQISIITMLKKGGQPEQIVLSKLSKIVSRTDIDIQILSNYINSSTLIRASLEHIDALHTLIPNVIIELELQREIAIHTLNLLSNTNDIETARKLCNICDIVINCLEKTADEDLILSVIKHIFDYFKTDEIILAFSTKLSSFVDCEIPLEILLSGDRIHFVCVHELLRMSEKNLSALLIVDKNVDLLMSACWEELKSRQTTISPEEISAALMQMQKRYNAQFTVVLNKCWDASAISLFIKSIPEIPVSILVGCLQKQAESRDNLSRDDFLTVCTLRELASKSEILLPSARASINDEDFNWSKIVISSLTSLIQTDSKLFIDSISEQTLLSFSQFILYKRGTDRLLYEILTASNSITFLNSISPLISQYIIKNSSDTNKHQLLIPLARTNLPMLQLINIVPTTPVILRVLVPIIGMQKPSELHNKVLEELFSKFVDIAPQICYSDPLLSDLTTLISICNKIASSEVQNARQSMKISGFKKLYSSNEELHGNDCVASILLNTIPESNSPYCKLVPTLLPKIFNRILETTNEVLLQKCIVWMFKRLVGVWNLLIPYSLSVGEKLQITKLIYSIFAGLSDNEVLEQIRNIIKIHTSIVEVIDNDKIHAFLIGCLLSNRMILSTDEAISIFVSMFASLHFSSLQSVRFIVNYVSIYPESNLSMFNAALSAAINEVKNPEIASQIIGLLSDFSPSLLCKIFSSDVFPTTLMRFLTTVCSKNTISYLFFISKFCTLPCEERKWTDLVFSAMTDLPSFVSKGRDYVCALADTINALSIDRDAFTHDLFDFIANPHLWKLSKEQISSRNFFLFTFVMFASPFDSFVNRQQNINSLLTVALSNDAGTSVLQFALFSLFMRVIFIRASTKLSEAFASILVHELGNAVRSQNEQMREEADKLLAAAMTNFTASFQFEEFVFFPDLVSMNDAPKPNEENSTESDIWPMIEDSKKSLIHLDFPKKHENEPTIDEFIRFVEIYFQ